VGHCKYIISYCKCAHNQILLREPPQGRHEEARRRARIWSYGNAYNSDQSSSDM